MKDKILIVFMHGLGDNMMLTPAVRELAKTKEVHIAGFKYLSAREIWQNNKNATYHELDINFHPTYWDIGKLKQEKKCINIHVNKLAKKLSISDIKFITISDKRVHSIYSIANELNVKLSSTDYELNVSEEDKAIANKIISTDPNYFIVHPFAGVEHKEWNINNCHDIVKELEAVTGLTGIVFGINEPLNHSIGVSAWLIKHAKFFVGTDSLPLHISTAMNTSSIGLFISTYPARTSPATSNNIILSSTIIYQTTPMLLHLKLQHRLLLGMQTNSTSSNLILNALQLLKVIK